MQTIIFRADSSSSIGTGHIMRDLVLAKQFEDAEIIFAVQDLPGNINEKIREKGYRIELLDSNDIEEVVALAKQYAVDMVVIDHYGIDYDYEKALKEKTGVKIFVLDDIYEKHYCDILLNHNVSANPDKYKGLIPENCEIRCGAKYTLLREEFSEAKKKKKEHGKNYKNIFIAMGGADHSNINIDLLKVLGGFTDLHAHVVTTKANAHLNELKEYVRDKQNITLHINTDQIAKLMQEADFAIVTPSVTLNEVIYMELPFIAIKTADNQNDMYEYLINNGYQALEYFDSSQLKDAVETLFEQEKIELVNFTELSPDEKEMVLAWRNHPKIRERMFTQNEISLKDHMQYIESLATKSDRVYFLVRHRKDNIGVIDFTGINLTDGTAEFGLYANPDLKGMGTLLMNEVIYYAFNTLGIQTLICEVFEENVPAIKLYERYGFKGTATRKAMDKTVICMELKNENR